jgi:molybdopterin-guanine dinucleotide biosynthesis protein A
MRHSAVLLAGGKSSRMGRDKTSLEIEGQPLLAPADRNAPALSPETAHDLRPAAGSVA